MPKRKRDLSKNFGATEEEISAVANRKDRIMSNVRADKLNQALNEPGPYRAELRNMTRDIHNAASDQARNVLRNPGDSVTIRANFPTSNTGHAANVSANARQAPLAPRNPNLPNYNPDVGRGMMTPDRSARIAELEQRYAHARNIEENALRAVRNANRAKSAAAEGAGILTRGRAALNSGVARGVQALADTNVGRLLTTVGEKVGSTAAGRVAGAVLSKTAVPLMVAQGAYDAFQIGKAGYDAFSANAEAQKNEKAMTDKYGSVEAATRTRHEKVREAAERERKNKKSNEESLLKQGGLLK